MENMDWIHLAKDKEKWWAYVNAVMEPLGCIQCRVFVDCLTTY